MSKIASSALIIAAMICAIQSATADDSAKGGHAGPGTEERGGGGPGGAGGGVAGPGGPAADGTGSNLPGAAETGTDAARHRNDAGSSDTRQHAH